MVMRRIGAWGKTKRSGGCGGRRKAGTMGAKSCPLAPKPWSQMTECVGVAPGGVVISMGARFAFGAGAGCMGFAWGFFGWREYIAILFWRDSFNGNGK